MNPLAKRVLITLVILAIPPLLGLLFTYEVIKVDWVTFMKIQPSYRAMKDPLPLPERSIPIEGAAYIPAIGSPQNPVSADAISLGRGQSLYNVNCALCHGERGQGDGPLAQYLRRKPANLTGASVRANDDGSIFLVITNGIPVGMPPLRENLAPRDRWDVVNYVRSLQKP
jgi:mono/diheme cytochrome c family protein